jgi:HEAT repeat protein
MDNHISDYYNCNHFKYRNNTSNITSTTGLNSFATIAAATPSTGSKVENTQDLICKLQSQDSAIRIGAAKALGTLKDQQAIDPLINALQTDDSAFRISVINALAEIGDERAVEPLIAFFNQRNDNTTIMHWRLRWV